MTDYKEEQCNEIEVLQSIYPDELTVLETEPFYQISMRLTPEASSMEEDDLACVTLKFTYTATYPDELPVFEIEDSTNLDEDNLEELLILLKEQGQENIGMAMIFMLCSATLEWLNTTAEQNQMKKEQETEKQLQEEEAAAFKQFQGTRVTIETFISWRASFDSEMALLKKTVEKSKKLTGRELFENNQALEDDDDISFLPEGEDVKVDESLFADDDDVNLDELDLEDSENELS
ncbi:RWD domain-containing protein 1 [Nymphon striatum]|nr:RWD domain-containing protein 1 [Nymphon striatum]KAG1701176.1 RWD domain-containing protein 1 [Nymphon striatum]